MLHLSFTAGDVARTRFAPSPAPMLELTAAVATLLSEENTCFGTMNVLPRMAKRFAYCGAWKFSTAVLALGAVTDVSAGRPL